MFHTILVLLYTSQVKAFTNHLCCAFVLSSPRQNCGRSIYWEDFICRLPSSRLQEWKRKTLKELPATCLPLRPLANILKASARHHLPLNWCQAPSISHPQPSNLAHIPGTGTHPTINPDRCLMDSEIDFLLLVGSTHFGFHLTKPVLPGTGSFGSCRVLLGSVPCMSLCHPKNALIRKGGG